MTLASSATSLGVTSLNGSGSEASGAKSSDGGDPNNQDHCTTLYFGNLHPYVAQKSLEDLCSYFGAVEQAKVIKDKSTGTSAGYGFVRFADRKSAEAALQALNGKGYLGHELRVNWALPNNHKEDTSHHHHIFVGDLGSEVTDAVLYNAFCTVGRCSDARVMWDHSTGRSKGYGFVSFRTREEAEQAIDKMQGKLIGSRKVRCGWAQHKQDENTTPPDYDTVDKADPSNTNVYVGNIAPDWAEADISSHFSKYGPVTEVKLHKKGGYGFVKFDDHESAVKAIVDMHAKDLYGRVLKCSWGKNIIAPSPTMPNSATTATVFGHLGGTGLAAQAVAAAAAANASSAVAAAANHHNAAAMMMQQPLMAAMAGSQGNMMSGPMGAMAGMNGLMGGGIMGMPMVLGSHPGVNTPALSQMIPMALATQMMMMSNLQQQQAQQSATQQGQGHNLASSPTHTAAMSSLSHAAGLSPAGSLGMDHHSLYYSPVGPWGSKQPYGTSTNGFAHMQQQFK